jgi:hypothetical protein
MMDDPQQLERLLELTIDERLRLAQWLIESAAKESASPCTTINSYDEEVSANPLLALVGRYSGGPGDTAERAEEILQSEVDSTEGLSLR